MTGIEIEITIHKSSVLSTPWKACQKYSHTWHAPKHYNPITTHLINISETTKNCRSLPKLSLTNQILLEFYVLFTYRKKPNAALLKIQANKSIMYVHIYTLWGRKKSLVIPNERLNPILEKYIWFWFRVTIVKQNNSH